EHREKIGAELDMISGGQEKIDALKTELEELGSILSALAADLANKREQAAKRMQKVVEKELRDLSMNQARFAVNFQYPPDPDSFAVYKNKKVKVSLNGIGASEFFFSSNPGEELRPLAKIASGGEISRVMLALKSILNDQEATPTMIFDEVDSGISGKVAEQVGVKLKKIAKEKQVFSITHLPQIAGMASAHYLVHKAVKGKRTQTMILELDYEHRVEEIARMSGGEKISATTLRHAKEMIK
ncbi:MAG: DNA repair protein RecN, partial [Nitrospinae bacterium]|nr:DNA repair protein RecN [Nitrospinota bacterium]